MSLRLHATPKFFPASAPRLTRFHAFLADKSQDAADRALDTIEQGLRALCAFAQLGRAVSPAVPELREWIIPFGQSAYVALYRRDGEQIVILAMRHGREDGYGDESSIES